MALTATQYTRLRDLTGGRTTTSDRDHLTDAELQDEYDDASSVWDTAIVYVLRRRIGMASAYVDKSMDLNSESLSQRVENMRDMLKDAEERAGVSGGTLSVGKLKHNINTKLADLDGS